MNKWLKNSRFRVPSYCVLCDSRIPAQQVSVRNLCAACVADMPSHGVITQSPYLSSLKVEAWAAYQYAYPLANMLQQTKYQQRISHITPLAQLLRRAVIQDDLLLPDAILPVPLHRKRLQARGFNQAHLLSKAILRHFQLPLVTGVVRHKETAQQAGMKLEERQRNMRNAFGVTKSIPYSRVVIVDDVVTTGSTVGELAKCLLKQGVDEVDVWALAYALPK